jgi:glutaredoxin
MSTTKKIEIYSTPSCHFCHMEKDFLTSKNIPFTDYNVAADMEKRKYILDLTGQLGVPVTVITDPEHPDTPDVFVGFSQALLEQKLGLATA